MAFQTLRIGSSSEFVKTLQLSLGLTPDGDYGKKTAAAVTAWQTKNGLYADGEFGPISYATWLLRTATLDDAPTKRGQGAYAWERAPADAYGDGYNRFTMRADAAADYQKVYDIVHAAGGIITSAGARRDPDASVGENRSAVSFHYLGLAFDLALYSGMVDPNKDPFIVTRDEKDSRYWRVYVRVERGEKKTLTAWTYRNKKKQVVEATVLDFTELMLRHGFHRIPARLSFFGKKRNDGAAEWWHFERHTGLVAGKTTFGELLSNVWTPAQLEGTGPWKRRHYRWTGTGFSA